MTGIVKIDVPAPYGGELQQGSTQRPAQRSRCGENRCNLGLRMIFIEKNASSPRGICASSYKIRSINDGLCNAGFTIQDSWIQLQTL
jgi:hypothetical protein